jgi:glycosyltransferase involved in cell wall biosynthesis
MEQPWLTVVTVVKDALGDFQQTAQSVASQDLSGVEYLIIDSSLSDAAVPEAVDAVPGLSAQVTWTPPLGIYQAMNIGLEQSRGDYVYFANAGDVFFNSGVLRSIRSLVEEVRPPWLFGDVEILEASGHRVITPRWDYEAEKAVAFSRGHFPCHQGMFVRLDLLRAQGGFDLGYSIVADYAAFLRLSLHHDPLYVDEVIATFREGGVSTTRWKESFRQFHHARREILAPKGVFAVRERLESLRQFAMVFVSREILSRMRKAAT